MPLIPFCGAGNMMRFAIILFLGMMALKASGKPGTYLVETADDDETFEYVELDPNNDHGMIYDDISAREVGFR